MYNHFVKYYHILSSFPPLKAGLRRALVAGLARLGPAGGGGRRLGNSVIAYIYIYIHMYVYMYIYI